MTMTMEPADEDCEQEHRPSMETAPENRVAVPRFILDSGQDLPLDHAKTSPKKKRCLIMSSAKQDAAGPVKYAPLDFDTLESM
jgi:hypothetical protein